MLESLFYKVADLRPATLLKKRLQHRCFPVNFARVLGAPFLMLLPSVLFRQFLSPVKYSSVMLYQVSLTTKCLRMLHIFYFKFDKTVKKRLSVVG